MLKHLVIALFIVGFAASAQAKDCKEGSACWGYQHAQSHGPVPYQEPCDRIAYKQAKIDNLVIRFYDAAGNELDPHDPLHNREAAPMRGTICPGEHWVREAFYAILCNSFEGRVLTRAHLDIILADHGTPRGKEVQLDLPRS
jgi:hypothetical protein